MDRYPLPSDIISNPGDRAVEKEQPIIEPPRPPRRRGQPIREKPTTDENDEFLINEDNEPLPITGEGILFNKYAMDDMIFASKQVKREKERKEKEQAILEQEKTQPGPGKDFTRETGYGEFSSRSSTKTYGTGSIRRPYPRPEDLYYYEEESEYEEDRPVPMLLFVFLVTGYIFGGAVLFQHWEGWTYLNAAYFCFITLTTVGFGDFVPAQDVKSNPEVNISLCSVYLIFGLALIVMSFNLVQDEVIAFVKDIAIRLGLIKDEDEELVDDYDDEDV